MIAITSLNDFLGAVVDLDIYAKIAVVIGTTEDDVVAIESVDFNPESGLVEIYIDKSLKVEA